MSIRTAMARPGDPVATFDGNHLALTLPKPCRMVHAQTRFATESSR